jgi:DNA repair photolyase
MCGVIYESRGKAKEYCELAANLYAGCGHGCTYCYAPSATFKKREEFYGNCHPRNNVINQFAKDARELRRSGETRSILLSFTTDPYQPIDTKEKLTREAIKILHSNNLKVTVLTKGGRRSERDFDLLSARPELSSYGATLVFSDETMRQEIEPGAAPTKERIEALEIAHDEFKIPTWASFEPVWTAKQSLELMKEALNYIDLFKIVKLNYHPQSKTVDWKQFALDSIKLMKDNNKNYYIKDDLRAFL